MLNSRPPAIAGIFYPRAAQALETLVKGYFSQVSASHASAPPQALITPHAGYRYSGRVAAAAYAELRAHAHQYRRVVVIGPAHRKAVRGFALSSASEFETPLGAIPLASADHKALLARRDVIVDDAAHETEHALETQLPFLQSAIGHFALIPIIVGEASPDQTAALLAPYWDAQDSLIVTSTDLSHFLDYASAQARDTATREKILDGDFAHIGGEDACGFRALGGLLRLLQTRQARIRESSYATSGDVTGEHDRVVGYGSFVVYAE